MTAALSTTAQTIQQEVSQAAQATEASVRARLLAFRLATARMPSTTAVQLFGVVPGIAGGLAGFWLADRIKELETVRTADVLLAAGIVAGVTLGVVLLVRLD